MKALIATELIMGIILTIMGGVILFTAITTAAGLESIVAGGLFALSGIVAIINGIINIKKL